MLGFTEPLQIVTTSNCSAIIISYTLDSSLQRTLSLLSLPHPHRLFGNDFPLHSFLSYHLLRPYQLTTVSQLTRRCYATI
jgi:hypothetical protein